MNCGASSPIIDLELLCADVIPVEESAPAIIESPRKTPNFLNIESHHEHLLGCDGCTNS